MTSQSWRKGKVLDFFELQRGFDLTEKQARKGHIPVISSSGLSYYHNEAKVNGPGVITGRKGKIGNVFFIEEDFWPHDTSLWVKDFKGNYPKFIYHFLQGMKLEKFDEASSVPTLNRNNVHRVSCQFPPVEEQKRITLIFDTWDKVIEKTERLIVVKEKWFSWLIKSMISNQCDKWEHLRADKVFKSISDKGNAGAELLSVTQDRGVIPRTMLEGRVMSPEGSTDSYKLIKEGDFAISLRSFQGGIEYSRYQGLISPAYTVLRPNLKMHNDFYRHFFKSYLFIEKYLNIAVIGIRDGKQISIPDFITVKIPYPPLEMQESIAKILNTVRQEIDLLKKQSDAYSKQKHGLMQKLLTGQWRVGARQT